MKIPTYDDIRKAHQRIDSEVHRTPVLTSSDINEMTGCHLYFKCENFQKTGAFKFRGATNAVISMTETGALEGVATHSSGNHAAALALAAKKRGIGCYIAMPHTAPKNKIAAVKSYGGKITFCEPTLLSREETLVKIIRETGSAFVHPYDNFNVICGQGTAAKELLEDCPGLEALFVPVGGGGILSGSAISAKAMQKGIRVYGCEPAGADDAYRSFQSRKIIPSVNPCTIADGLLTSLSEMTFSIMMNQVDEIFTVSEKHIITAMQLIWERMKIIVEPSAAVAFAVVMQNPDLMKGIKAGVMLTGGNADLFNLPFAKK